MTEEEPNAADQTKGKTKAKQRYLKRKKERRKINKKSKGSVREPSTLERGDGDDDDDENEDDSEDEDEKAAQAAVADEAPPQGEKLHRDKRPKKRRKIAAEPELEPELEPEAVNSEPEATDDVEMQVDESKSRKSPTPQAALPSFPLPVLPDAPSKSTLALQGLDQALVDAEIISPSTVLPISTSLGTDTALAGLSEKMRKRLNELGISELFAVQTALLPFLLPKDPFSRALYQPYNPPRDVCVSAPTGSGKTLAYAVPIVEILSTRIVTRLRALIILPTRDLVTQVRETFEALCKGRSLKIGTATGQHSFSHEQAQLIADRSTSLSGGSSKVDILICTPGRLMDHLSETPNFSLQHLRFLVIDEADRLLAQSFQDWLVRVLAATRPPKYILRHSISDLFSSSDSNATSSKSILTDDYSKITSALPRHDAVAPAFLHLLPYPDIPSFITERKESSCQKLLFSATLTRDPSKIATLELRHPKYFVVHGGKHGDTAESGVLDVVTEKFSMPTTLREHMIVCETSQKPLLFFHLVHAHNVVNALVFTKSTESTTRLVRLFQFFENSVAGDQSSNKPIAIRAYSSDLGVAERRAIFDNFKSQEIQILVCSDLISRGIDISHVSHVVNYDAPVDMRKYVHRAGRTARAGREGDAWTLVEEQEARYFKNMMKEADHFGKVKRLRVSEQELAPLLSHYDTALSQLKEEYSRQ